MVGLDLDSGAGPVCSGARPVRWRGTALTLFCLLAAVALGACGTVRSGGSSPGPSGAPSVASTSASSPNAPALPAPKRPKSDTDVARWTRVATLNLAGFHPETAKPTSDKASVWRLAHPCNSSTPLPSDRKRTAGYERVWDGETIMVRQYTVGYRSVAGKQLLAELRGRLRCASYKDTDGRTATMLDPAPVRVAGIDDGYAWCEALKGTATVYWCTAMLARGNFVTEVNTSWPSQRESRDTLDELTAKAAAALVKAV